MITVADIKAALDNNEFFIEYLPTMRLEDNVCVGAEALIRWNRNGQVVPPLDFIPLVEGTVLAGMITYWVIDTVAQELGPWAQAHDDVHIGINVPPELWGRGGVFYTLKKSPLGAHAHKVVFELSERGIPDRMGVQTIFENIYGAKMALDDMQLEEANMIALARLKVDFIKIDKSVTDLILGDSWQGSLQQKHLLNCSYDDSHTYIAEGVEEQRQADVLRDAGFRFAQGWLFSKSLKVDDFLTFFAQSHAGNSPLVLSQE